MSHSLSQRGCRRGWTVLNHRGLTRLNIAAGAGGGRRRQLLLPVPWQGNHVDQIRDAVVEVYDAFREGIDPETCVARMAASIEFPAAEPAAGLQAPHRPGRLKRRGLIEATGPLVWQSLVEDYRKYKLISGEIKASTWHRVHRHHMRHVLAAMAAPLPPESAKQLLDSLVQLWPDTPGGRTRQIQMQCTAALLRWGVGDHRLGEDWEPPQDLAPFVGRSRAPRAITTPLEVEHILALVLAIPDLRWRFAFQLMAAYGLRPEELQHLQVRQGRLWCLYEKVASRGKTKPRVLRLLPCDDWADGWRLEERFPSQELPPMQPGLGGGYFGHYLMNRTLWKQLRRDYEARGEKLVPYSCRHGYAHRAHVICDLPPKVVAAAMGHSVQTHLAAYSRWCGDDVVDDAFAKAQRRLLAF
ncbi:hypothetical protein [Cyanobium sp. ATX 6F1]|uniref:hypothetical protein n=1 Tax=unclassified Cyanobium TaxID=2627006 RepID=UPI0020CDA5A3|nr:hypothetical protein [Cyanobium sp. ATX 6F1]MCP9915363.1 hypothetical protein [Cyanobium sp. ATX 6F1]